MNYIREYYNKIQSGEVVVSEKVSKVYKKLLHEIEHPGKHIFDEKKAERPIEFI